MPKANLTPASATRTPQVAKDILAGLDPRVTVALQAAHTATKGIKGADITRALIATGHLPNVGKGTKDAVSYQGKVLRDYMRSHGAYVGSGNTYGLTVAQARRIAAGFIAKVPPPAGVRYAKGERVESDATPAEVAPAA